MPAPSPQSAPTTRVAPNVDLIGKNGACARRNFWLDGLAFSNVLPAAIAAALTWNSSVIQGAAHPLRWAGLACAGTFIVYGIDRLRDLSRDRASSPRRTAFIERHASAFRFSIGGASLVFATLLVGTPMRAIVLLGLVGVVGLLHRRLKKIAAFKTLYVSFAWTAICVGIPGLTSAVLPEFKLQSALWLTWILFSAFVANLIASSLRDGDARSAGRFWPRPLALARLAAYVGVALAFLAPDALFALVWIPALEALALAFYRPTEHYGLIVVDGALLVGACLSLAHRSLPIPGI